MKQKFKAKRIDNNEWIFGCGICVVQERNLAIIINYDSNRIMNLTEVHIETVCEFLFNNKEGVEIYSNDKIKAEDNDDAEFYTIEWNGFNYNVVTYGFDQSIGEGSQEIEDDEVSAVDFDSFDVAEMHESEVIGNIHDNN